MSVTTINGTTQIRDDSVPPAKVTSGVIIADGTHAFTGDQSMGSHKLTNLANGTASGDAVNKGQLDAAVTGLLDFQGTQDCSANPNYPAASKGDVYLVSVAGKIGGASGKSVDAGDMFVATADNAGGTEASVGTSWTVVEHNVVAAALTKADDTNVTLTLGGTPTAALLAAVSLTLGWTGTLAVARGGTGSGTAGGARTNLGATTVGANIFTVADPSAVTFLRVNADNTVDLLSAADFRTAIGATGGTLVTRETPSGTVNGSNTDFVLASTPTSGTEMVFVNGVLMDSGAGNDYTISGATITFLSGAIPQTGDKVRVTYWTS